jgi:nucleoside-diphosphate kinase
MGATNPENAAEGTIRKRLGRSIGDNIIHGSDTDPGSAEREVGLHFPEANWANIADPAAKAAELTAAKV